RAGARGRARDGSARRTPPAHRRVPLRTHVPGDPDRVDARARAGRRLDDIRLQLRAARVSRGARRGKRVRVASRAPRGETRSRPGDGACAHGCLPARDALRRQPSPLLVPGALPRLAAGIFTRPRCNYLELQAVVVEPGRIYDPHPKTLTNPGERVLYAREGPTASVLVSLQHGGERALLINGRSNASDAPDDMSTQVLLAQLPILLAPRTDDVFVVGWGSGVTVGSALASPARRVTAAEIEPAVVEASRLFLHGNHDPLADPRLRLYADYARHILLAADERYDVIVSEPPHPWVTGVANIFTR